MSTFGEFSQEMLRTANGLEAVTGDMTKSVILNIVKDLIQATPVDTGKARSRWQVSTEASPTILDNTGDPGVAGTLRRALSALDAVGTLREDQPLFIRNDADHIGLLNQGHSLQASAGFIESTIEGTLRRLGVVVVPVTDEARFLKSMSNFSKFLRSFGRR
jgi:hypothetical protein